MYTSYDNGSLVKIATLLKSHKSEHLSGEDLSESLGLSRAAVWKHIKKLQALGYRIDSKPKIGYKLDRETQLLLPWEISDGLKTELFGKKIYYFDTVDSTQNFALKLASKLHESGAIVVSERQTHGRGRLNRKWISPKGGIWMSLILHPDFEISVSTLFPIIASLALAVAIETVLKIKPRIKWPNDILVNGKKVAGILIDSTMESGKIGYLVLGVGINFNVKPDEIEKNIKKTENYYGAATLVGKNNKVKPVKLLQVFLYEFENLYKHMIKNEVQNIIKEWTKRSATLGKMVTATYLSKTIRGKALRIDADGALVISSKGKEKKIFAGDVS